MPIRKGLETMMLQRHFESFQQAADEAAISRLYGGIHFRVAIDQGVIQGSEIGKFINQKIVKQK